MCVYAALMAMCALLVFVFPETKGREMPDTVNQAEYKMKSTSNDEGKRKEKNVI